MSAVIEKKQMKNGVLILTMNRPQVLNAMNKDLIVGLLETFKEIEKEKESRVVVLTGKGKGFCSGADLANGDDESIPGSNVRKRANPVCDKHINHSAALCTDQVAAQKFLYISCLATCQSSLWCSRTALENPECSAMGSLFSPHPWWIWQPRSTASARHS